MILDLEAVNPAFPDGKLPEEDLTELMEWARSQLGLDARRTWKLISARRKLSKVLFEIEEARDSGPVRLIAKVSSDERTRVTFDALKTLWTAGFRPPSKYTAVEPVAWFDDRNLVILERAPGVELVDKVEAADPNVPNLIEETARWLVRLHQAPVEFEPWHDEPGRLEQWTEDLAGISTTHAKRLRDIAARSKEGLRARRPAALVPCHGDFHLLNMFVAESGRMTGIDVDKFGGREASEEVAYFLAQTASICFHRLGGFAQSLEIRRLFLRTYEDHAKVSLPRDTMGCHMAATLIKNLHFDLFTYRSGRQHIVGEWLGAADRCLSGDIDFA